MKDRQPKPLTRREHREQERARRKSKNSVDYSKRTLLRNIAIGGIVVGVVSVGGATALGYSLSRPQSPATRVGPETELAKRVADLDPKINGEVGKLAEVAPEIVDLSLDFLTRRMGYDSFSRDKIRLFSDHNLYLRAIKENDSCIDHPEDPYRVETTFSDLGLVLVSLYPIVHSVEKPGTLLPHPATRTAEVMAHAGYHQFAKFLDYTSSDRTPLSSELPFTKKSGLGAYYPRLDLSKPGQACFVGDGRYLLDEVVVQSSALETLWEAGIDFQTRGYRSYSYWEETDVYRRMIVKPYFPNDHMVLLRAQQASDHLGYFRMLGRRIDARSTDPVRVGEQQAVRVVGPFLNRR